LEIENRLNHLRLVISDSGLSHSRQRKARSTPRRAEFGEVLKDRQRNF